MVLYAEVDHFHSASVIQGIKKTLQDGESIVFFYCDVTDERTTRAAVVVCSILSQLLRKLRNGTGRGLIKLVDDIVNGQTEGSLVLKHAGSMAPFVSRAARQFSRQPFVILDALDECQDVESLIHALRELTNGGVRLFVTSRPLQIIRDKFHDLPSISMNRMAKEVSADIRLHVTREIDGERRLRILEEKLKTEILITLQTKADGMLGPLFTAHISYAHDCGYPGSAGLSVKLTPSRDAQPQEISGQRFTASRVALMKPMKEFSVRLTYSHRMER